MVGNFVIDDVSTRRQQALLALQRTTRENIECLARSVAVTSGRPLVRNRPKRPSVTSATYFLARLRLRPTSWGLRSESEPRTMLQLHRCTSI